MLLALDPGNAMGRILLDRLHQDMANPISTSSNAYVAHDDYLDMASKRFRFIMIIYVDLYVVY